MKKFIRVLVPLLLAVLIIASIGWYLFTYDRGFTRDFLLTHITHNQSDAAGYIPLRFQVSESDGRTLFHEPVYINAASSANAGQPFTVSIRKLYRRTMLVKVAFLVDAA